MLKSDGLILCNYRIAEYSKNEVIRLYTEILTFPEIYNCLLGAHVKRKRISNL